MTDRLQTYLPDDLAELIRKEARQSDKPISAIIRKLIWRGMQRRELPRVVDVAADAEDGL